jgi:hypothetical protein
LLHHARQYTSRCFRSIFECRGSCISIQTTHSNTEEGTNGQKLGISLDESGAKLKNNEEDIVHNKRPFASHSVGCYTKSDSANRAKHKDKCNTPRNLCSRLAKFFREIGDGQGHREEVESNPTPCEKGDLAEREMLRVLIDNEIYECKHTRKNIHCFRFTVESSLNGFGAGSYVGRIVVTRLARYVKIVIFGIRQVQKKSPDSSLGGGALFLFVEGAKI